MLTRRCPRWRRQRAEQPKPKQVGTTFELPQGVPRDHRRARTRCTAPACSPSSGATTSTRARRSTSCSSRTRSSRRRRTRGSSSALAALELKSYRDAYQTLLLARSTGCPGRASEAQLEDALRRAAEGAAAYGEALKMALKGRQASTPDERTAALAHVGELVDASVGSQERGAGAGGPVADPPGVAAADLQARARLLAHCATARGSTRPSSAAAERRSQPLRRRGAGDARPRADRRRRRPNGRTVGVVLPMTGKYKAFGEAVMRGIQLALKGSDVELVVKDTQGDVDAERGGGRGAGLRRRRGRRRSARCSSRTAPRGAGRAGAQAAAPHPHPERGRRPTSARTSSGNMLTYSAQAQALAGLRRRRSGLQELRGPLPEHALRRGADQRLLGPGDRPARRQCAAPRATPRTRRPSPRRPRSWWAGHYLEDRRDYFENVQEATKDVKDSYRRRKAVEKAKSKLDPIVDFEALLHSRRVAARGTCGTGARGRGHHHQHLRPAGIENLKKTTGKKDIRTVTLLGGNGWSTHRRTPTVSRSWWSAAEVRPLQRLRGWLLRGQQP